MLDQISKTISISTILLILLGVFNLQQHYFWYDIKIFDFLDASEILLSFSDILMNVFVIMIFTGMIGSGIIGAAIGKNAIKNPSANTSNQYDIVANYMDTLLRRYKKMLNICLAVSFLTWFVVQILFIVNVKYVVELNALWFTGSFLVFVIFNQISNFLNSSPSFNINHSTIDSKVDILVSGMRVWGIVISFAMLFAITNYFSYRARISGYPKYSVELVLDSRTFATSKDTIYIDQTRNYIFFMELDTKRNIAIPMNTVKNISMKKLSNGL